MSFTNAAANLAWSFTGVPASLAFASRLANPRAAQERILRRYLTRNSQTVFGREHRLEDVRSIVDFQRAVPIRDYDEFAPYIDRVAAGEPHILTRDPTLRLMPSSGSTRPAKLIPYTAALQAEFNRAIGPWINDLFRGDPALLGGSAYWSISPAIRHRSTEKQPIPIGYEEDSSYLGGLRKRLVDMVMAVPGSVRTCENIDSFHYVTLRYLLARRDLTLISVWHPSFLELLLDAAEPYWERLVSDIEAGTVTLPGGACGYRARLRPDPKRARILRSISPRDVRSIWPRLRLISAWADAHATGPARRLAARFPGVRFQPKGLLATEAFITIPMGRHRPLAICSHFFEFLDDSQRPHSTDDLRVGQKYGVVVTTAGGLWRHRLGDRVRVDAMVGRTPSLEFVGRDDHVQDLCGEKLSEHFVAAVLQNVLAPVSPPPIFAMLAPETEGVPRYTLFIECNSALNRNLASQLDDALRANPHYAYGRALGQLGAPAIFRISADGYRIYLQTLQCAGRRIGDMKPSALADDRHWAGIFAGAYVSEGLPQANSGNRRNASSGNTGRQRI